MVPHTENGDKVNLIISLAVGIVHQMRRGVYGTLVVGLWGREFVGWSVAADSITTYQTTATASRRPDRGVSESCFGKQIFNWWTRQG